MRIWRVGVSWYTGDPVAPRWHRSRQAARDWLAGRTLVQRAARAAATAEPHDPNDAEIAAHARAHGSHHHG